MKISTEIGSTSRIIGEEKAVELVAKAGFDAWDFSLFPMVRYDWNKKELEQNGHPLQSSNYVAFAKKLKQIGLDNGIVCNQSHAPFPSSLKVVRDYLKRAIECSAIADAKICVIHPYNDANAEQNAEFYSELLPFAKQHGVKIATENMWNWDYGKADAALPAACSHHDDFLAHINAVNDESFVACLDIGHAEMRGLNTSAEQSILTLGNHLQALHIHDNDKHHDSHQIPLSMNIDFEKVVRALKKIGYNGYFTLEADAYLSSCGYTPENVFEGIKNLADSAKKLADMFEQA